MPIDHASHMMLNHHNWGEPERAPPSQFNGQNLCMYVRYVWPFKFRCVYPLQFLVHFNTRARAVNAFLVCWSRGMVITLWRAFLLSPTMNLDGKRGFSGEPAEENTPEIRCRERE